MKKIISLLLSALLTATAFAQNTFPASGSAGIGTTTPKASSLLDMESTSKGFLAPQMTSTQKSAISSPAAGLLIYQTNGTKGYYYYTGTAWKALSPPSLWTASGNNVVFTGGDAFIHGLTVGRGVKGDASNTIFGLQALNLDTDNNLEGNDNTAIGFKTLSRNSIGNGNVAVGYLALANANTYYNTATGAIALYSNVSGLYNTANGYEALFLNTSGAGNTSCGNMAGFSLTDGSDNIFIGYTSDCGTAGHIDNGIAIGYKTTVTSNNHVRIGNSAVTSIAGYVGWTTISDGRVKRNIRQNVPGLAFINKLQPVTYNLDLDAADKIVDAPVLQNEKGRVIQPSQKEIDSRIAKQEITYTGFIAQDVEKSAKELGYDFSGVDAPQSVNDLYGLRYADFVVPLVKAVQELSAENDLLKSQNENLQARVCTLETSRNTGTNGMVKMSIDAGTSADNIALLGQNIPNPFDHNTLIPFRIPSDCHDASIAIVETATGKIINVIPVSCIETKLSIDAGSLATGNYSYSLYVDGKLVETKQMVLGK